MPPQRPSKFDTRCYACGQPIRKGDLYTWGKRDPATGKGKGFHPGCYKGDSASYDSGAASKVDHAETLTAQAIDEPTGSAGELLQQMIEQAAAGAASQAALAAIESRIAAIEARATGTVISIEVRQPSGETVKIDGAHKLVPRLIRYLSLSKHVYLYGAPGGGKSYAVGQAAKALGRYFAYYSGSPQSPRSDLMGLIDAMGTYRAVQFRRCFEKGGVFFFDEGDNQSAATAVILNTCLANGWGAFPDGMVDVHPGFVCVVAGNTSGRGGDPMFPERRLQDSAFLDRFRFMEWEYDEALEEACAIAANPKAGAWLEWIRQCRAFVSRERIRGTYFTPRASIWGATDLKDGDTVAETADALCFRGVGADVRQRVLQAHPLPTVNMA